LKKIFTILFFVLSGISGILAQNFPVRANLSITPPYSVHLQDYITPGIDRMALNLLLTDITTSDLQVKLRVTIEGQGVKIRTSPNWLPDPFIISGGISERYVGFDLSEYFNPNHLTFEGLTKTKFSQTGALPEGVYRFCIEVVEYNRNVVISNTACVTAWLILNDPPLVNIPANGTKVRAMEPQNMLFQWTPRHTGSPNSAFSTEYEFKLVEIWPKGRNPNDAILSSNTIFETTTQSTTLIYGIAEPPLVPGRSYAFRVQAKSIVGIAELDLFKNNGFSETVMFTFGDECKPPVGFAGETISPKRIGAKWKTAFNQTEFTVRYREKGDAEAAWFEEETFLSDIKINGLKPDTEYEMQVSAGCGTLTSDYTPLITTRTELDRNDEFACGATPDVFGLENTAILPSLRKGDYIYVNDFDIRIDSIGGGNGVYSGTGIAEMPFLSLVKVRVRFSGITINTDYRMIDGQVFSVYNPNSRSMVDLDKEDDITEGETDSDATSDGTTSDEFNGTEVVVDADIESVQVNDAGNIAVQMADGTTQTIIPETNEDGTSADTRITDSNGSIVMGMLLQMQETAQEQGLKPQLQPIVRQRTVLLLKWIVW
jgi:hypothetical protein